MTTIRAGATLLARSLRGSRTKPCFLNREATRVRHAGLIGRMKRDLPLDRTARASATNRPRWVGKDGRNSRLSCENRLEVRPGTPELAYPRLWSNSSLHRHMFRQLGGNDLPRHRRLQSPPWISSNHPLRRRVSNDPSQRHHQPSLRDPRPSPLESFPPCRKRRFRPLTAIRTRVPKHTRGVITAPRTSPSQQPSTCCRKSIHSPLLSAATVP